MFIISLLHTFIEIQMKHLFFSKGRLFYANLIRINKVRLSLNICMQYSYEHTCVFTIIIEVGKKWK